MQNLLPWIIAGLSALAVLGLLAALLLRRPRRERKPLPTEWSLSPRPVFSADERRVFRLLREALPHHVVMCKLPVVRFCQPTEARDVRYWYELLGGISVNFAICSPNGRVLAAIDLETDRPGSSRSLQIKQAVLAACRIRYLRTSVDQLPSATELQLLVPYSNQGSRASMAPMPRTSAHAPVASAAAARRAAPVAPAARNTLWNDSPVFSDSFFAPDSRYDAFGGGESMHAPLPPMAAPMSAAMAPLPPAEPRTRGYRPRAGAHEASGFRDSQLGRESQFGHDFPPLPGESPDADIGGVVVDSPRYGRR
ncbi:hypothetical protein FHT39_003855 [Mitsuaria sp. BK045]|jgi:hypothetical protein|uniref:DUF2726 domain-containing protein n=1 Tax=unclassified Roseateles TaxID=2626991 RepID=UPI00161F6CC2|nr:MULTISPECIES: DUF2726 domain-containing protein [unclassified Roseateles]MBB3295175.1 hypothetical protein [Mitsuaria sp. BK041]MBB3364391.1 hypothetical protein [Mitsuaria sp. BK045]